MRTDYNPFTKDFDEINVDDLEALQTVAEGWYVEYKREVPNAGAVAKSITAFANTYGGWLFYGIDEKSKEEPVAGSYPGIPRDQADGELQKIRQAVANHAQPSPFFLTKAIFGPSVTLGLAGDRCIIVGYIPWGPDAPYIHKDGRIYRRVGDGSEPKPENDRFILDQLWQRSSKLLNHYAQWVETEPENSEGEENAAYVRIFIIPDFWRDHPHGEFLSLKEIREIVSSNEGIFTVPFNNVYRAGSGFICRQTNNNNPEGLGLTLKIGHDLNSEILVPLAKFNARNLHELYHWLDGYDGTARFVSLLKKENYTAPTIIDLNLLTQALLALSLTLTRLLKAYGWNGDLAAKIQICGVWRTVPFIDAKYVLDEYEAHGMPLSLNDEHWIHKGKTARSFQRIADIDYDENGYVAIAMGLFVPIAIALGIPLEADIDAGARDDTTSAGEVFIDVGNRAREVQTARLQREDR